MKYFVTGATGFVGGRVARMLAEAGHSVVALARTPAKARDLSVLGIQVVPGDVTDQASMREPMRGADGVYHIAGWYKLGVNDAREAEAINVQGTRNVLELMRELGIPRGVYTSTLAVYSDTHGPEVDESYRFAGTHLSLYDRTKAEAHQLAEQLIAAGLPLVIVQPGLIYGPGDTSSVRTTLLQYLQRKLPVVPKRTAYSWAHVDDIARAHLLAMQLGRPGQSYHICGSSHTLVEALALAERITGRTAAELSEGGWADIVHPDDLPAAREIADTDELPPKARKALSELAAPGHPGEATAETLRGDSLRVADFFLFDDQNARQIDFFEFSDATINVADLRTLFGTATEGDDELWGTSASELLDGQVRHAADARRRVLQEAGLGFHRRDQILDAAIRRVARHHQHVGHHAYEADRLQVLQRIELQLQQVRGHGLAGVGGQQQRGAIGRGARGQLGGDGVRRAGAVLDHDVLLQRRRELVGEHAGQDVGAAAGRCADHDAQRLVEARRLLGNGERWAAGKKSGGRAAQQPGEEGQGHGSLSPVRSCLIEAEGTKPTQSRDTLPIAVSQALIHFW